MNLITSFQFSPSSKLFSCLQSKNGRAYAILLQVMLALVAPAVYADDHPTYYAQWGGDGKTNVCIHYTTPALIYPWYEGSIQWPTRVEGAMGTPNYSLPIICGGDGAHGNASGTDNSASQGYNGYQPLPINTVLYNQRDNVQDQTKSSPPPPIIQDALAYISMGGWGGGGGNGDDYHHGGAGGKGSLGGDINLTFLPGAYSSINNANTSASMGNWWSTIFVQSVGGSGGNGGSNGGTGGTAGWGGTVNFTNSVSITANSYGIFAQSQGGWGGNGANGESTLWSSTSGGSGAAGGGGGSVNVVNKAPYITSTIASPIFAQSIGGGGGQGGNGSSTWYGDGSSGGAGGYGGPGGAVSVTNYGQLNTTYAVGQYGIFAQSVGGGGGDAGSSAELKAIGASGGYAASGSLVAVNNYGQISLINTTSSVGIFAQSIGGGGGTGGMATGLVAIGGSGGEGGNGGGVAVINTGSIFTGGSCASYDSQRTCTISSATPFPTPITSGTNGGGFGILAQSVGGGGGSGGNGASYSVGSVSGSALGGSGGNGGQGGSVYVGNTATIQTREINSAGIFAQSIGGGGGSGGGAVNIGVSFATSYGTSTGGDGGAGGNGGLVGVNCPNNSSTACSGTNSWATAAVPISGAFINTNAVGSPGILAESIGGGGGHGGYAVTFAASAGATSTATYGGTGGAGGSGKDVYASPAGVTIYTVGQDSPGVLAASIGGGGGSGGQAISGTFGGVLAVNTTMGGSGAKGGTAGSVSLVNAWYTSYANDQSYLVAPSSITTYGDRSYGLIAQSIAGGGGSGGASNSGSLTAGASVSQNYGGKGGSGEAASTVYLWNDGTIQTSGYAASAIVAQSIGGGGGNGGTSLGASAGTGTINLNVGGAGGAGGNGSTVQVTNNGNLTTTGLHAPVIMAQSIGGGGGNGGMSASASFSVAVAPNGHVSIGGSGGSGGNSNQVWVANFGSLSSSSEHSQGIFAQSIGGGGGNGGGSFAADAGAAPMAIAIGGSGGSGGAGSTVGVNCWTALGSYSSSSAACANAAHYSVSATGTTISTAGNHSSGILAMSVGGGGGNGGFGVSLAGGAYAGSLSVGGSGGNGGNGNQVYASNAGGDIKTAGTFSSGLEALSVGGGGGRGGMTMYLKDYLPGGAVGVGSTSISVGGSGGNGGSGAAVITEQLGGTITTAGTMSSGIFAASVGGRGGHGGLAATGVAAIAIASTSAIGGQGGSGNAGGDVLINSSGTIKTSGVLSHGIEALSIGGGGGSGGWSADTSASLNSAGALSIGGLGGTGSGAGNVTVNNYSNITTSNVGSTGITALSIGGGGGNGGSSVGTALSINGNSTITIGGNGTGGASAGQVNILNYGTITSGKNYLANFESTFVPPDTKPPESQQALKDDATKLKEQLGTLTGDNYQSYLKSALSGMLSQGMVGMSIGGGGGRGGIAVGGDISGTGTLGEVLGGNAGNGGGGAYVGVNNSGSILVNGSFANGMVGASIGGRGGLGGIAVGASVTTGVAINDTLGGTGGNGGGASQVDVVNAGVINTQGFRANGMTALSQGGNGGMGGIAIGGSLTALTPSSTITLGGSGGNGGIAGTANILNLGSVTSIGPFSTALAAQSLGGDGGVGGMSIGLATGIVSQAVTLGGQGGNGAVGGTAQISSSGSVATYGPAALGVLSQSIGGNGGMAGLSLAGLSADKAANSTYNFLLGNSLTTDPTTLKVTAGSGQNGGTATATISGSVSTFGALSYGVVAESIGGGGGRAAGSAAFSIFGTVTNDQQTSSLTLGGQGGNGGDAVITLNKDAKVITQGLASDALYASSVGGGGGNAGLAFANLTVNGKKIASIAGGSEGSAGNGGTVTVDTSAAGTVIATARSFSDGIFAQSIGGGGGTMSALHSVGGAAGILEVFTLLGNSSTSTGGSGGAVNLKTGGTVTTYGPGSTGILGQSIGGGGGQSSSGLFGGTTTIKIPDTPLVLTVGSGTSTSDNAYAGYNPSERSAFVSFADFSSTTLNSETAGAAQLGGFGKSVGNGGQITLTNASTISTYSSLSDGIKLQSIGGGGGVNYLRDEFSGSPFAGGTTYLGGGGVGGGSGNNISNATNNGTITTAESLSLGILAQSIGGGGGDARLASLAVVGLNNGYSSILGSKNGAMGGVGNQVNVTNNSPITTAGQGSDAIVAQSIGGGGGFSGLYGIGQNAPNSTPTTSQATGSSAVGVMNSISLSASSNAAQAGIAGNDGYLNTAGGISTIRGASFAGVLGSSGASVSDGGTIKVTNSSVLTTGNVSDQTTQSTMGYGAQGIVAQSIGGGGGILREHLLNFDQSQTSVALMLGGVGSTTGNSGDVTVENGSSAASDAKTIVTNGSSSIGVLAQSIGGGGGFGILTQATSGYGGSMDLALILGNRVNVAKGSGAVNISSGGQVTTNGDQSEGLVAQSISGGGGVVKAFSLSAAPGQVIGTGISDITPILNPGTSDPGIAGASVKNNMGLAVTGILGGSLTNGNNASSATVSNSGSIFTVGSRSTAIVAQSINGGGGLLDISAYNLNSQFFNGLFNLGGNNGAASSKVIVTNDGSITTKGNLADGILAQSISSGGGSVGVVDSTKAANTSGYLDFTLGAPTLSSSQSGEVVVTTNYPGSSTSVSNIQTSGFGANAIVAQSVGGGGGLLAYMVSASDLTINGVLGASNSSANPAYGVGQAVTIPTTGNISTSGTFANGIVAQSISGGGGLLVGNQAQANGAITLGMQGNGGGSAGAVNVTTGGSIKTAGVGAIGIVAQSIGAGGGLVELKALSNATLGGTSNSLGDGGPVNVTIGAPVTTTGNGAIGVLAQSIGGGGGAIVTASTNTTQVTTAGGYGNGGAVTVTINAPITTSGTGAYGVIAQSIAGGGGVLINPNGASQFIGTGGGTAGTVSVVNSSNIFVSGAGSKGIFASNAGKGVIDPSVTITKTGSVLASGGASAVVLSGALNTIQNNGVIAAANATADAAVDIRGSGSTTNITNNGYFFGAIRNQDSGLIQMTNAQNAKMFLASSPNLGSGGTFVNSGYLQFAHPELTSLSQFTYRETLQQTATGVLGINFSFKENLSESIKFEKKASTTTLLTTANAANDVTLGGNIHPVLLKAGLIAPGSTGPTQILDKGGDVTVHDENLGVINTAIMTYGLIKEPTQIKMTSTANFTPAGLSPFGYQVGNAIGSYQTAGSNAFFQAATAQLVTIPTVGALDQAYANLAGSAIQAMPEVNYQAVTRAVGTVSDRMNSWRVGDSFIATTKNPRALMSGVASMNQPITPNAPQVANGTLSADGGQMPISLAKKTDAKTWITPFGGTSNSNNLATQIYGGSIGIEAQSDDSTYIGGAAVTISQSNYTYSSSTTPATPGAATNYGASIYGGARGESAYLSAIGYLGGSSGNFTRQLQALGFNTSTGVNVHSNILGARVEAGYNLLPNPEGKAALQITPFVAIAPTQIRQNGANEYFGSLGSGFYYGSNINTAVPVYLGTEVSGELQMGHNEVMKPFLRVSWAHDLMNNPMAMSATYTSTNGPTLYANGTPSMGNMVIVKGGAKYNWGTKVSAYATIDLEQGNAATSYRGIGGSIGAIYSW